MSAETKAALGFVLSTPIRMEVATKARGTDGQGTSVMLSCVLPTGHKLHGNSQSHCLHSHFREGDVLAVPKLHTGVAPQLLPSSSGISSDPKQKEKSWVSVTLWPGTCPLLTILWEFSLRIPWEKITSPGALGRGGSVSGDEMLGSGKMFGGEMMAPLSGSGFLECCTQCLCPRLQQKMKPTNKHHN